MDRYVGKLKRHFREEQEQYEKQKAETEQYDSMTTIGELRPGAIFVTEEGVYAVKSEYYHNNVDPAPDSEGVNSSCQCVLLDSGEYAWFKDGNATIVHEVVLPRGKDETN